QEDAFAAALVEGLGSGDESARRLAAEAMAAQSPGALQQAIDLLSARGDAAPATVEALIRSGRPELFAQARHHLEKRLAEGGRLARLRARLAAGVHPGANGAAPHTFLQIALDDYVQFVVASGVAGMRALHGKRGFATV